MADDNGAWTPTQVKHLVEAISAERDKRYAVEIAGLRDLMDSLRDQIRQSLEASEKAVDKAEEAQRLRNESQNEWRKTVSDIIASQEGHTQGAGTAMATIAALAYLLITGMAVVIALWKP